MSVTTEYNHTDLQQPFIEKVVEVEDWFAQHDIEHRVIGSLATSAYLGTPVNFNRPPSSHPEERVPDIDVIVPRKALPAVREYREQLLESEFPISLGLSFPSRFVDMRPNEASSYLTGHKHNFEVPSETFQPVTKELMGVDIMVPTVDTLYYTHLMVGLIRKKDQAKVADLKNMVAANVHAHGDQYQNFENFVRQRENPKGLDRLEALYRRSVADKPQLDKRIQQAAKPLASLLRLR